MPEFAELVEKEIPRLRRYARALCRSSSAQADDLVQDTLLRGIAKQHLWKEGTNLRAWLLTLMHNQFVNNIRHSAREGTTIDIEDVSRPMVAVSDPSAPLQLRDLERALAQLPVEQRQVILLIGLEGLSYQEAAQILAVPTGTVRSRLSRSRDQLRQLLGMHDENDIPLLSNGIAAVADMAA
jgi:RNA polymerase sigma-70 factor, ECF subfamily